MTISDFGEVPESLFLLGGDCPDEYTHFVAYWLWYFLFLWDCLDRILNMLSSSPMGFVFFVFWDCLEECAPVMAFGFLSFAYTSMSKFTYSCICM